MTAGSEATTHPESLFRDSASYAIPVATLGIVSRADRWRHCLAMIAILLGVGFRIARFLAHPSYWNDEAAVVLNLQDRSVTGLLHPLDYAQVAPPLFLWAEKLMLVAFGGSEYALRAIPALLGLAAMPLFALLALRRLPAAAAVWAIAWFSLSDKLIQHGNEVKQYSGDVFIATLLLFLAFGRTGQRTAARRLAQVAAVAVIAVWFSHAAVFIFGAISLALFSELRREGKRAVAMWIACNAAVVASFAALYVLALRQPHDRALDAFWSDYFPDFHHSLAWAARSLNRLGYYPFSSAGPVLLVLVAAGSLVLVKLGRAALPRVLGYAVMLNVIAAIAHQYPFAGQRLSLYLLPLFFFVAAAGAEPLLLPIRRIWVLRWWWLVPAGMLAICIGQTVHHTYAPEDASWMRPVAAYVRNHFRDGDTIHLVADLDPRRDRVTGRNIEFLCYWRSPPGEVSFALPATRPMAALTHRSWVILSASRERELADAIQRVRDQLGPEQALMAVGGSAALLFEGDRPLEP